MRALALPYTVIVSKDEIMTATHPGEYLKTTYQTPLGLSTNELARLLDVAPNVIQSVLWEDASLSADLAVRLEILFDKPAVEWMTLQMLFDLYQARAAERCELVSRYPEMNRLWVPGHPAKAGHYFWRKTDGAEEYRVELLFETDGVRTAAAVRCYETTQFEFEDYRRGQWRCT